MSTRELHFDPSRRADRRGRDLLALLLWGASRALGLLAERLVHRPVAVPEERTIEFHGDAGAPEGALYVDGQLVGHVLGVNRL